MKLAELRCFKFWLPAVVLCSCVCIAPVACAELRVGVAAVEITPPVGAPMAGYYSARGSTGVHDPLRATAMVIEQGDTRVALVALDLISTTKELVTAARELIAENPGIPADAVMISASHTHTGPSIRRTGRDAEDIQNASAEVRSYLQELPARIATAVRRAAEQTREARLEAAVDSVPGVAFNRRFEMTDGTVGWNPPKRSPQIVRPAGPTDDDVPVVVVRSTDGDPLAVYVNFAMHLDTVGGTQVSADYPAPMAELLRRSLSADLVTLFTIGAAGDINHRDVHWADRQKGIAEATRIGTHVASAALRAVRQAEPVAEGPLRFRRRMIELRPSPLTDEDVQWASETSRRRDSGQRVAFLDQVRAGRIADVAALDGRPMEGEVQVISLGDGLAWVGLPGEIFVELGLAIKQHSPFRQTMIAELSGGSVGYVPTRRAYSEGNYEAVSARVGEGSGERLVEAALAMLTEFHRRGRRTGPNGPHVSRRLGPSDAGERVGSSRQ